jgi:hypothetical protein
MVFLVYERDKKQIRAKTDDMHRTVLIQWREILGGVIAIRHISRK